MSQDGTREKQERRDFFISYTGKDEPWAEWIAAQLDAAGYTFYFQAWDFRPGSNFVAEMDNATRQADRTLLVLSAAYLASGFAFSEWAAAFRQDPTGSERRLLPVRIEPCELDGLLAQVGYLDLVGSDAEQARECLLKGIQTGRVRPEQVVFSGQQVAFPGAFPARWNIPFARNPFFTGREELLERLHTQLNATQTAVALSQPQAISGLGGIGKTQLAIEYAYRYRSEYQAVLWARAETIEALNASYTEIARVLHLPQQDAQEQDVIVQAVKHWLRGMNGWLLILDNADDLAVVEPFVPTVCPGHLVLTTRAQTMGKLARRLEVETLDREVGVALLLRRAGFIRTDAPLDAATASDQALALALTEELGGLPLALDQAGAYIEETQCSLTDYQRQYQTQRAKLLALRGGLKDEHPEPVATTWSISFQKVEAANPTAAELLRICAFLAPDAIPEELLVEVLKTPLSPAGLAEQKRKRGGWFSPITRGQLDEAVALLRAYSLVQRNPAEKTVQVHRLVQAVVRETLERQEIWMVRVIQAVNALFPLVRFETWGLCERYLPQALICNRWIGERDLILREGVSLLDRAGQYLYMHAQYEEAEPLYKRALRIAEQLLGAEHPSVASILNNLAGVYESEGRYGEVEPLYKRALRIMERQWGTEHPSVASILNNLAGVYKSEGRYEEAESLYKRALRIMERQWGTEHPDVAGILNNLAGVYESEGRYGEAESLYKRALEIREQLLGAGHPDTAISLDTLAGVYESEGRYGEAEQLYKRALEIKEQRLGAEHPETARSQNNLALLYKQQGRYGEAEWLYKRALRIAEQQLGAEHPNTVVGLNNLADLYWAQGKHEETEPLLKRALAITEQKLGGNHPDMAQSLNKLGVLYYMQGRFREAEPLLKRALIIRERELGVLHPSTQTVLANYISLLEKIKQEKEPLP